MEQFRFFVAEAWEYLWRGRGASLAAVVALSAVLFLLALVLLVTHNVSGWAGRLTSREGITVFLDESVGEARALELATRFSGFGEVQDVRFVPREEALQQLESELGGFSVVEGLGENPLPNCLAIQLQPGVAGRPGVTQRLAAEIRAYQDVDDVVFGDEWVDTMEQTLARLHLANVAVGALAALAVGLVLYTTLRLVFIGRRETTRILKMVGATDRFIRSPFLVLGGMHCLLSGCLALGLLWIARLALSSWLPGFEFEFLPAVVTSSFLLGAFCFGVLAAYVAIEPSLHGLESGRDELLR